MTEDSKGGPDEPTAAAPLSGGAQPSGDTPRSGDVAQPEGTSRPGGAQPSGGTDEPTSAMPSGPDVNSPWGRPPEPGPGHTAPLPPYQPYAPPGSAGAGYPADTPGPGPGLPYAGGSGETGSGGPYLGGAGPVGGYAASAPPRRGRGGLIAGAVALALVAGGAGGAVGALATRSDNNPPVNNALAAPAPAPSGPGASAAPPGSVPAVAQRVVPSVVMIRVTGARAEGEGSGVVLSSDGLILTNNHVATGAGPNAKMEVAFSDGSTTTATIVGVDPVSDLAVIRAAGKTDLKPIELGTSHDVVVGQSVVAVGSPLGLAGTVTSGIVSALNRPVSTSGETGSQGAVISAVQTDAAINPGNSGGALVDTNGRLVGVNTAIATLGEGEGSGGSGSQSGSIGLGFAIPVDQARRVADQLIKSGHATYAQIGISVRAQDDANGARVLDVTPDGPAAKAGVPKDSIVTKVDDQVIDSGNSLIAAVRSRQPGDKVKVTFTDAQGQNPKTVEVTLEAAPAAGPR